MCLQVNAKTQTWIYCALKITVCFYNSLEFSAVQSPHQMVSLQLLPRIALTGVVVTWPQIGEYPNPQICQQIRADLLKYRAPSLILSPVQGQWHLTEWEGEWPHPFEWEGQRDWRYHHRARHPQQRIQRGHDYRWAKKLRDKRPLLCDLGMTFEAGATLLDLREMAQNYWNAA